MFNYLVLLVLTSSIQAAEPTKSPSSSKPDESEGPSRLIGGGGENKPGIRKHRIPRTIPLTPLSSHHGQQFIVPTNPPSFSPRIAAGIRDNHLEVVDIVGHMEAQDLDSGTNRGWWQCLMHAVSRWCGSRSRRQPLTPTRPLTPPRLYGTDSAYRL
jgi:hypothetical protein